MGLLDKLRGRKEEAAKEIPPEPAKKPQEERIVRPKPDPAITNRPQADRKDPAQPPRRMAEPERRVPPERRAPEPEKKTNEHEKKAAPRPIPKYTGPVTRPPAATAGSINDKTAEVGIIYGNVGTSKFSCRVTAHMEKSEYIMAEHEDCGPVLCQVGSLIRKTDLTVEKTLNMDGNRDIQEIISAEIDVVGYRDDRGLLQIPRTTFRAGKPVYKANDALIQSVLGLKMKEKTGAYIGLLHGHGVPVYLNINDLLQ